MASPSLTFHPSSDGRLSVSIHTPICIRIWYKPSIGQTDLISISEDAVAHFGKDHEYTKLIISHDNVDPEDVYSTVAYEKGFHFLYYLDRLVGRENFNKFIPHYFTKWAGKSLDSFEFRDTFVDFFNGLGDEEIKKKVATIDWEGKLYTPGLPPKPEFDMTLAGQCYELAAKWENDVSCLPSLYLPSCRFPSSRCSIISFSNGLENLVL